MRKNQDELKKIVLTKGPCAAEENLRIYDKFFKDWFDRQRYIHQKFKIKDSFRILDIGCGPGHNLIHFSPDSVGLEVNEYMINFGKSLGLNIIKTNVEDNLPDIGGRFDLIWCTDFLIHLVSPFRFLFQIRKYLDNESLLVIQIPKISLCKTHESPEHFYAFDKRELSYLLKMTGYQVIDTSGCIRNKPDYFNKLFEPFLQRFGTNIWVLAKKDKQLPILYKTFLPTWF